MRRTGAYRGIDIDFDFRTADLETMCDRHSVYGSGRERLICTGIMAHMAIQVILNIAVVTNTIPNTGITLPFVSYGGTSVVFLMGEMGLALKREPVTRFSHVLYIAT